MQPTDSQCNSGLGVATKEKFLARIAAGQPTANLRAPWQKDRQRTTTRGTDDTSRVSGGVDGDNDDDNDENGENDEIDENEVEGGKGGASADQPGDNETDERVDNKLLAQMRAAAQGRGAPT
jgi:hypothetical protein